MKVNQIHHQKYPRNAQNYSTWVDVIKDIAQKFDDGERVVFVQGIGGIGKTEIVKQYAKR